jgi:RNA polymerase sigma factor (sigma-70 family)
LDGDPETIGEVSRWISRVLTSTRFWQIRHLRLDLYQEVMMRVIHGLRHERFDDRQNLRLYVEAIASYTALRELQRDAREYSRSTEALRFEIESPSRSQEVPDHILAEQALSRASDGCKALLARYFLEECSYEEIAAEMGLPVGTVKSRLHRCLQTASRNLRRRHSTGNEGTRRETETKGSTT